MTLIQTRIIDQLKVGVFDSRESMGRAAGEEAATVIRELLHEKEQIRIIFAAAPSQNEFLETLAHAEGIDWERITAFHMDEYVGLPEDAPQRFGNFLKKRLFDKVKPGQVHYIDGNAGTDEECRRYAALLQEREIDIVCMGIGENGHIAFNDPPVADFRDLAVIKLVELEEVCRRQQVHDGCFMQLEDVPTHALTLTIPALLAGSRLFCIVPGKTKREAVKHTLLGPITEQCPASILRTHPSCTLYLDKDAYEGCE
ncbi:glucosamine-6-phosphate deaminase [Marinicrinis lubricantis]|uniref:Glucosamine-6-phosphate deaminase n=1 Tax=Marinicrinis lubricantis TaxID=2086470 RepID=A0ABW1IK49_9BACL